MYNFSTRRGEIKRIKKNTREHSKYKAQNKMAEINLDISII